MSSKFCTNCGAQLPESGKFCTQCGTANGAAGAASKPTPYETRCTILSELWLNYRNDEDFADYIEYNDIALPLAYAISNDIVKSTDRAKGFINESWSLLLAGVDIEDQNFESLDELLESAAE